MAPYTVADDKGNERCCHPDANGKLRSINDSAEEISTQFISAHRMLKRWSGKQIRCCL